MAGKEKNKPRCSQRLHKDKIIVMIVKFIVPIAVNFLSQDFQKPCGCFDASYKVGQGEMFVGGMNGVAV